MTPCSAELRPSRHRFRRQCGFAYQDDARKGHYRPATPPEVLSTPCRGLRYRPQKTGELTNRDYPEFSVFDFPRMPKAMPKNAVYQRCLWSAMRLKFRILIPGRRKGMSLNMKPMRMPCQRAVEKDTISLFDRWDWTQPAVDKEDG